MKTTILNLSSQIPNDRSLVNDLSSLAYFQNGPDTTFTNKLLRCLEEHELKVAPTRGGARGLRSYKVLVGKSPTSNGCRYSVYSIMPDDSSYQIIEIDDSKNTLNFHINTFKEMFKWDMYEPQRLIQCPELEDELINPKLF